MGIIDITSKPLPLGFTEVIDIAIANLQTCKQCQTTADSFKLKDALEAASLAITVVSRDLNILLDTPNIEEVKK